MADIETPHFSRGEHFGSVVNKPPTVDGSLMCRDDEESFDPDLDVIVPTDEDEIDDDDDQCDYKVNDETDVDGNRSDLGDDEPEIETEIM